MEISDRDFNRFLAKVQFAAPSECWLWTGFVAPGGYGKFSHNGVKVLAHRFSWQLANEQEVPDGMQVNHTCGNRQCVNPHHLAIGTVQDA